MKFFFNSGMRLQVKIGTQFVPLKVVADDPNIPATENCDKCFFNTFDPSLSCEKRQMCTIRSHYHYELDTQKSTDNE